MSSDDKNQQMCNELNVDLMQNYQNEHENNEDSDDQIDQIDQ